MDVRKSPLTDPVIIIACGGKSTRMKLDKSLLLYSELPQRYHLLQIAASISNRFFLSLNSEQNESVYPEKVITDLTHFSDIGPAAGLLSVAELIPSTHYMFIGCDYPLLKNIYAYF